MTLPLFRHRLPSGEFSECSEHPECKDPYCSGRHYRYLLRWPTGVENDLICLGIFANPSKATPKELDPTLRRWLNFCASWGYGWSWTANVRPWRATDPSDVPHDETAIGPLNSSVLIASVSAASLIVCGWGKLGGALGPACLKLIRDAGKVPYALRLNKDGSPQHPLYLPNSCKPFPMEVEP